MTRFRKSSSTGQKRLGTNSRRVVKGLKRKRRRHLFRLGKPSINQSLSQLSSLKFLPNPSRSPASRPLKSPEEAQNVVVGSGVDLRFPRSAHDYHAEQGRHEQKGQIRHHCRRLDSLSAHRAWWRWVEVSVEDNPPFAPEASILPRARLSSELVNRNVRGAERPLRGIDKPER